MGGESSFPHCSGFRFDLVLLKSLIVLENALRFDNKYTAFLTEHEEIFKPTFPPKMNAKQTRWFVSRA